MATMENATVGIRELKDKASAKSKKKGGLSIALLNSATVLRRADYKALLTGAGSGTPFLLIVRLS